MSRLADEQTREQAALYALGALTLHEAHAFEQRLVADEQPFAAEAAAFQEIVANLALSAPEQTPAPALRSRLRARVSREAAAASGAATPHSIATAAKGYIRIAADAGEWREVASGAFVKTLFTDRTRQTVTSLVKLLPGARLPRHRHHGAEESFVIEGDCRVNGEVFQPGDYRCCPDGTDDGEVTTQTGTIFMLIASPQLDILEKDWRG